MYIGDNKHIKHCQRTFGNPCNDIEPEFADLDSREQYMRASLFLSFLDLTLLMPLINSFYKVAEGVETYPRRAMVRCMFWRRIKGIKAFTEAYRYLKTHTEEAIELGFKRGVDGNVQIPNYRTLGHFENERLGIEGLRALNCALVRLVASEAEKFGIIIGKNTAVDSTPIKTCANDPDGKWNPHYRKKMVKIHLISDVVNLIPLYHTITGGTDGDGVELCGLISCAAERVGLSNMSNIWFDGGYTSNENLAKVAVLYGLNAYYHIGVGWVNHVTFEHRFQGRVYQFEPANEINYQYPKMWKAPYFDPDAGILYKMNFLVDMGKYDPVAMYFRNDYITEYEECPDGVLDNYHQRNAEEGIHGILKCQYGLETNLNCRGKGNIDRQVLSIFNAALTVALIKLRHGIAEKLISVAYLT